MMPTIIRETLAGREAIPRLQDGGESLPAVEATDTCSWNPLFTTPDAG
jgi:hypothetical protein